MEGQSFAQEINWWNPVTIKPLNCTTNDLLACIGRTSAPRTEIASRREIRKYSIATGWKKKEYLDGDEAPPLFHLALFWDMVELDKLTPDGVSIDELLPKFPLEKAMAGGLSIDYFRPIMAEDVLVATRTLTNIYEKSWNFNLWS